MKELLQKIGAAELENISQLDALCDIVKRYYTDNERHRYSEVSAYLMETDDIEYLLENLRQIQKRLSELPENEKLSLNVFKLIDHITLELNRTKYNSKNFTDIQMNSMNTVLHSAMKEISKAVDTLRDEQSEKINKEIEIFKGETKSLKEKVEDSYSQFVAILGIFSAVVVVFFGGMTAFGSLFTNMHNIGRFKLAFTVSLIGFVIFNLIFMFLYVLAKLLKREISASENENVVGRWGFTRWLKRAWIRYPYMFMFNVVMLVILVTSFEGWYGATYWSWKI